MKALAQVFMLILLASCSPSAEAWRHSNTAKNSDQQLRRDKDDCHMYIDASRQDNFGYPRHLVFEWEDEFLQCMAERGWYMKKIR